MIIAALLFVFGAWNVQQLAQLTSIDWTCCAFAILAIIFLTQSHPRFSRYFYTSKLLKEFLLCAAAFIFGVCWASSCRT